MSKYLVILAIAFAITFSPQPGNGQSLQANNRNKMHRFRKDLEAKPLDKNKNDPTLPWRLPQNIIPLHYDVNLIPILENDVEGLGTNWTVKGRVKIDFNFTQDPTNKIVLHSKDLLMTMPPKIYDAADGKEILDIVGNTTYEETTMFLTIPLNFNLNLSTTYAIEFNYIAQIRKELHGMYRSSYIDNITNQTKWIAITQMEALNCRELLPSFDEPFFKATFTTTIGRHKNNIALTNGKSIKNVSMEGFQDWVWESFEETVKMPTYLFAIVISDYAYYEASGTILPNVVFRTYAPNHLIQRQGGVYSTEKGEMILKHYEEMLGHTYPLSKMDLASVNDFQFGAMENFGLNIYREELLLYFPDESTENERCLLTEVVAHELAHQFFGNLVSPAWWTHIYLNEGMSDYMEYHGLQSVAPEFKAWDLFLDLSFQRGLEYDEQQDLSHPLKIEEEAWSQKDSMSWFDTISYQKGGSIARMMEGFLTTEKFIEGLRKYIDDQKFSSAVQSDLFAALGAFSDGKIPNGMTLEDVMLNWTALAGHPYLTVTKNAENKISVTQTKFGTTSNDLWNVPISVSTSSNPNFDPQPEYWLTGKSMTLDGLQADQLVILNAGSTGFYRVLYEEFFESYILDQLDKNASVIHHYTRSTLLDDYFNFVWNGIGALNITRPLSFTKYMLKNPETEMVVWTSLFKHLMTYLNIFSGAGMLPEMKAYLLPRIKASIKMTGGYDSVGVDTKGISVLSHTQLLDWACALDDSECTGFAVNLMSQWINDPTKNPVPRDLRPIVYCSATKRSIVFHNFLKQLYLDKLNGLSEKQKQILLRSFSCTNNVLVTQRLLTDMLQNTGFHSKKDAITFLRGLAANYRMRSYLVSFMRSNTENILGFFEGDVSSLISVVGELRKFMSTTADLQQIQSFAVEHEDKFKGALQPYLEGIKNNAVLIEKFGLQMQEFFRANVDKGNDDDDDGDKNRGSNFSNSFLCLVTLIVIVITQDS